MTLKWLQDMDILQWFFTNPFQGSSYVLTRWVFLRFLGVIYLIAFLSLWVQIKGLIGSNGILPIADFLEQLKGNFGPERYRIFPTVLWFNAGDIALYVVCGLGVLFSIFLIVGFSPSLSLIVLWVLYLSLATAGRTFLSFQWDVLLLEVGFVAIFFAPMNFLPGLMHETVVSKIALFLLWMILFRLTFESGVVKLTSGDSTWWDFTALNYHYWTQPLPVWVSFYVHHMPQWFHKLSMIFMYGAELVLPFCIFFSRPLRIVGCIGMVLLQVLIGLTGNYTFFNLLTIALCLLLLDDVVWTAILPGNFLNWLNIPAQLQPLPSFLPYILVPIAILVLFVGGMQLIDTVFPRMRTPRLAGAVERFLSPFRSINSYGLFRVMTKSRPEIIIEGSNDGQTWLPYEFKWKPGDLKARPKFVQPHQPRLDWQMWFAALSHYQRTPWVTNFLNRLLQGSPDVLKLLKTNPFPDAPPRYVRALLYDYRFTNVAQKRATGAWWWRELRGLYHPVIQLR